MAKARPVVSDQHSAEVDEMRRSLHALLLVLQNVAFEVDAGNITADEAFTALLTTLSTAVDSDIATIDGGGNTYTGTGLTVAGVKPTPLHPRRPRNGELADLTSTSNY